MWRKSTHAGRSNDDEAETEVQAGSSHRPLQTLQKQGHGPEPWAELFQMVHNYLPNTFPFPTVSHATTLLDFTQYWTLISDA